MIDFHSDHSYRLAGRCKRDFSLLKGFWGSPVTAHPKPAAGDCNLDLVGIYAGEFYADTKTAGALENVYFRAPGIIRFSEI
jgi:hypothetical protein